MNLDLLKKFVKLANNNPNENEANSAARRVCKMIEAGDFKFVEDVKPVTNNDPLKKSPFSGIDFSDLFNQMHSDAATYDYKNYARWQKDRSPEYDPPKWDPINDPFNDNWVNPKSNSGVNNPKRELQCIKCRQVKETRFRGVSTVFICMECRGKAYTEV